MIRISGSHHYKELTFSMLYAYSEDFILVFSHDEVVHGKGSMAGKMPGMSLEDKFCQPSDCFTALWMGHPGKKLLFMGRTSASWMNGMRMSSWNGSRLIIRFTAG